MTGFPPGTRPVVVRRAGIFLLLAVLCGGGSENAWADRADAERAILRARTLFDEGDLASAAVAYAEAARRAHAAPWPEGEEEALRGVLRCKFSVYDFVGARDASRAILEFHEGEADSGGEARTLADLGYLETLLGHPHKGLACLERAVHLADEPEHLDLRAACLVRIANARTLTRDPVRALEAVEKAVRIYRGMADAAAEPDHHDRDLFDALTVLGNLHLDLGDSGRARESYAEAERACEGCEPAATGALDVNLAIAWYMDGENQKALDLLVPAAKRLKGTGNDTSAIDALTQLGTVYSRLQRHQDALRVYAEAAKLATTDPISGAYARLYAADSLLRLGRRAEALEAYQAVREEGKGFHDRQLQADAWRGIAEVALARGAAKDALEAARTSLRFVHEIVAGLAPISSAQGRDLRKAMYETAVRAGFATRDAAAAFEMVEQSVAAVLLERLGGHTALKLSDVPAELAREESGARERLLGAREAYSQARQRGLRKDVRAAGRALDAAQLAYEGALDRIQRKERSVDLDVLAPTPSPGRVQACLAEDEVLVLYAVAGGQIHAVVLTRLELRVVTLGRVDDTEADIRAVRLQKGDEAAIRKHAAVLRSKLLDPLSLPAAGTHLLISPAGALSGVPFSLLAEERIVATVPSATSLLLLRESVAQPGRGILAMGDPDYGSARDGRAVRIYWQGGSLNPLPGSRTEILAIPGPDVRRIFGGAATEEALIEGISARKRWRAVHLACHGLLHDERPALTALALSTSDASDGFLTVQEIFGLRVPADLAVLSACETSAGAELAGNGIVGLTQAFLYAGAHRVIASLWKVDDEPTQYLMGRFYAHWRSPEGGRRLSAAEALRRAQAETEAKPKWSHPRDWAAWVLCGLPE